MVLGSKVSAIKAGISNFSELSLAAEVTSVNVHCNSIKNFAGLITPRLQELDASSNQIQKLDGLERFPYLTTVNLACNQINNLKGIENLASVVYLNVSYNNIKTLDEFSSVNGSLYKLQTLELHGNQLSDINNVALNLRGVISLRNLVLNRDDTHSNPVCHLENYCETVFFWLPQLSSLDMKDRSGRRVAPEKENILKMLGLNVSLSELDNDSSDFCSTSVQMSSPEWISKDPISTPTIDAVLSKNRANTAPKLPHDASQSDALVESIISSAERDSNFVENLERKSHEPFVLRDVQNNQEERLKYLESQLSQLVAARQENQKSSKGQNKDSKTDTERSSTSTATRSKILSRNKMGIKGRGMSKVPTAKTQGERSSIQEKETYLNLVKELESERERRWKSEQAAKKLAEIVRRLNEEKTEGRSLHDMASQTADKLKQALILERERSEGIKSELVQHKQKISELSDEIISYKNALEQEKEGIERAERNTANAVASQTKILSEQAKKLHESEMRTSAALREVEIYKGQNCQLEKQLSELHQILCTMKREHKKEKENMFSMDSLEFKNALSKEIHKLEKRHREEVKSLQITIATLRGQYAELEDEFRQALHIEAERYEKVNSHSVQCGSDLEKMKGMYRKTKEKEEKCQSIITQLTSVAKEQKLKIAELLKGKKEMNQQYEDRIDKLEVVAENGRKNGIQLELVKQEKSRLVSQLAAVQTVIDGLRDERKLWGHELAQQGASLAQDRGRLESRIETLQQEIMSLRKQNERDLDALKIKSKIVEDQTETIHKMKQALMEKDQEVIRIQKQSLETQKKLEQDIEDVTHDNAALHEQISALLDRKKQLKDNLADSEKDLDNLKQVHGKLVKKWSEKGLLLTQLEKQVKQMKETYDKRAQGVTKERDQAIEAKRIITERLAKADAAFREQLEATNSAHQDEMLRVIKNGENELEMMRRKVVSVEEEMREVLRDADRQKKVMEAKLKKVTSVFSELQEGLKG